MPRPYSLGNPHPDHHPQVGRVQTGRSPIGRGSPLYGTTLSCSCGQRIGRVSNSAPSSSDGRADTQDAYKAHVAEALKVKEQADAAT